MKRPPLSSLLSLIVFHAVAACSVDAAPSTEEILSTRPKDLIGLYTNGTGPGSQNPNHNYTSWLPTSIEVGGSPRISYHSSVQLGRDSSGYDFLRAEGYFVLDSNVYLPTAIFVDSTRPDELEGGVWTFGYSYYRGDLYGGAWQVASWTWTQDPPSTPTPSVATIPATSVSMSLDLNRAVARSLRGKESRAAVSLLERQRKLLRDALAAAN
jgi:hypothetical protein